MRRVLLAPVLLLALASPVVAADTTVGQVSCTRTWNNGEQQFIFSATISGLATVVDDDGYFAISYAVQWRGRDHKVWEEVAGATGPAEVFQDGTFTMHFFAPAKGKIAVRAIRGALDYGPEPFVATARCR